MPAPKPVGRYLHSAVLVGADNTASRERGVASPRILMFGGYDGGRYLDDLWELAHEKPINFLRAAAATDKAMMPRPGTPLTATWKKKTGLRF